MFFKCFNLKNADLQLLKTSALAFVLACLPVPILEFFFGKYTIFGKPWVYIGVGFHEIGHIVFNFIAKPLLIASVFFSFLAEPIVYLGGFLFNGIVGIVLLWFSLLLQSKISSGVLRSKHKPLAFSFLFIAYINIFLVPYTLTHLQHVVGSGADFTVASAMLGISLEQLLVWMWAFNWAVLIIALLLNIFFIFRKQ